jgi:hypothetical protein
MPVTLKQVNTNRDIEQFIRYPFELYRGSQFWLPPLLIDERNFFNPKKNKACRVNDTISWLAYKDGKLCGRIMGIISHVYNKDNDKKQARFFRFECVDDPEVAHALISAVENWAVEKGMEEIIGPFGFSDKDPQGLLVSGYDQRAVILAPYNPPYYPSLVENEGYQKEVDLFEYMIPVPDKIPEFYARIYERVTRNKNLECRSFKSKKEIKPYIIPVLELMNETFRVIYGSYELDREEMESFAAEYMTILDVEFLKVVTDQGKVVAFLIALPDVGPGMQKARGRLFPFGIFHLLREMKKTDFIVLMLGGIKPSHQGTGLDVLMGVKMLESAAKRGIKKINSHLELETNLKVRAEMEKMGGEVCKKHRIYKKSLVGNG